MKISIFTRKTVDLDPLTVEMIYYFMRHVIKWIQENLGIKFMFRKLDLLFIPEFKQTARENAGCIALDDKFLTTQNFVEQKKYKHFLVFELLFTLFDFFATPVWWDELWLNESIVFFLTSLCLKQLSETDEAFDEYADTWLLFGKYKARAIEMDQFKNTHKLRDEVHDTDHATFIYDSISYYKGASVLKYLHGVVGDTAFFLIIKEFLNKNQSPSNYMAFINTLSALSTSNQKYTDIIEPFIDNRGLNNLLCSMHEESGFIKEFCVTQQPCTNATDNHYYHYEVDVSLSII
jgi:aminopeptidase N